MTPKEREAAIRLLLAFKQFWFYPSNSTGEQSAAAAVVDAVANFKIATEE